MFLAPGGYDSSWEYLSSTEVYRPSAGEWREVPGGALPRPMNGMHLVTLNNRVLLFGEKIILIGWQNLIILYLLGGSFYFGFKSHGDILEYSKSEGEEKWTKVGEMSQARVNAGVSVVSFEDFKNHCQ